MVERHRATCSVCVTTADCHSGPADSEMVQRGGGALLSNMPKGPAPSMAPDAAQPLDSESGARLRHAEKKKKKTPLMIKAF